MKKLLYFIFLIGLLSFPSSAKVMIARGSGGADVTAPEFSSATINGTALVVNWSENCTRGVGYNDNQLDLDMSTTGSGIAVTYQSGDGTSQWSYTAASAAVNGETVDLDFDGTANSIEDGSGNDLAALVSSIVTNETPGGYATPAYVQSESIYTGAYDTNTSITGTTGNVLALVVTGGVSQTVTGVTANAGTATLSSWTEIIATTTDVSAQIHVLWASITSGGTVQVRPTGSVSDAGYAIIEISGIDTSTPVVGSDLGFANTDTSAPTGAVTTTIDNSFAIAVWASEDADSTITWGNGGASPDYTARVNENTHIHKVGTKVCSPTGNYTFSPTWTGNNKCETVIVVLEPKAL